MQLEAEEIRLLKHENQSRYEQQQTMESEISTLRDENQKLNRQQTVCESKYQRLMTENHNLKRAFETRTAALNAQLELFQTIISSVAFRYRNIKVGDEITFGIYRQSRNALDEKQPVEWIVLAKGYGRALLVSKYILDVRAYH